MQVFLKILVIGSTHLSLKRLLLISYQLSATIFPFQPNDPY